MLCFNLGEMGNSGTEMEVSLKISCDSWRFKVDNHMLGLTLQQIFLKLWSLKVSVLN
jgi:hypothetical protein